MEIIRNTKTACLLLSLFTVLTGFIYPVIITSLAQIFFAWQANGSLIERDGKIIGSTLIGQYFADPKDFWGRPSGTKPLPYSVINSTGSNMGPSNPAFLVQVKERIANLHKFDVNNKNLIPVDLVTASGSGLDPDISYAAAMYQVPRIAKSRNLTEKELQFIVEKLITPRSLWILGEPRINVLELNMSLNKEHGT